MNRGICVGLDEGKHLVQRTHGYAIAELAMAMPALLIVTAMALSIIGITVTQIQLESAATLGARIAGRGESIPKSFQNSLPAGTEIFIESQTEVVEVTLKTQKISGLALFPFRIDLTASAKARLEPNFEEFD